MSSRTVYEYTEVQYKDENDQLETIQATDNHEFFVVGIGWVDAEDLAVGQELVLANGERATVEVVTPVDVALGMAVFNLTVTDGATYYVDGTEAGVDAVAVHNARRFGPVNNLLVKLFGKRGIGKMGRYGKVQGHHPHSQAAMRNLPNYNPRKALAVPEKLMRRLGIDHDLVSLEQGKLYRALRDQGVKKLTLKQMNEIEVKALMAGHATEKTARRLVARSLAELRSMNVRIVGRVPHTR